MAAEIEFTLNANLDSATREVAGFRKQFAELVRAVETPLRAVNATRTLEQGLQSTGTRISEARDRLRDLQAELVRTTNPSTQLQQAFRNATAELQALQRQEGTQVEQLRQLRQQLQAAGVETSNLVSAQRSLAQAYSQRLAAGRADSSLQDARNSLGVGQIEAEQRSLLALRQQYQLVMADATLSARQRQEAEARYQQAVQASLERLRTLRAALGGSNEQFVRQAEVVQRGAMSAGEYQQAVRMLPAQLTDVATSLASGMPVWLVAIQQGGQIRDMFHGWGNAASAVRAAISPALASGLALTASLATLYAAYQSGRHEADAYNQALLTSGNTAGTTADELAAMAARIDQVQGTEQAASAALAQIAASGKIAAGQMEAVAVAALAMEEATGKAVSETVAEFVELAKDPVAASAKLNDQYAYLTASVYQQIIALKAQGKEEEAAKLAIEAYASAQKQRADDISQSLGWIETLGKGIKKVATEMWDALLGIGRSASDEKRLEQIKTQLEALQNPNAQAFSDTPVQSQIEALQQEQALIQRRQQSQKDEALSVAALATLQQQYLAGLSDEEKQQKQLAELDKVRDNALKGKNADQASINQQYEVARQAILKTDSAASRYLGDLQKQLDTYGQVSEAAKARYAVERGELQSLSVAQKQQILAKAAEVDAYNKAAAQQKAAIEAVQEAEKKAAAESKKIAADRLEIQKTYQAAIQQLSGSTTGSTEASYGNAQDLKVSARQSLASGDTEQATKQAEQALQMLLEMQKAGENTYGLAGFAKELQSIALEANQIDQSNADKKLADLQGQLQNLQQAATVRPELDEEATKALQQQIQTMAEDLKKQLTIPVTVTGSDTSASTATGTESTVSSLTGYASGGFTGAGGKYEPAGVVHRGEFVHPGNVVAEPGALSFFEQVRQQGFTSTMDRLRLAMASGLKGYADGGLVIPQPSLPAIPDLSPALQQQLAGPAFPNLGRMEIALGNSQALPVYASADTATALRTLARKFGKTHR